MTSLVSTWGTCTEDAPDIFKCQFHKFEIDQLWQSWQTLGNKVKHTYTVLLLIFSFSNWQGWLFVKEHTVSICILDFLQTKVDLSSLNISIFKRILWVNKNPLTQSCIKSAISGVMDFSRWFGFKNTLAVYLWVVRELKYAYALIYDSESIKLLGPHL